jgi:hypothetical protein
MTIPAPGILTLLSAEALIEVYMSSSEPQTLRDEYSWATEFLDAQYKPASLDDVIKSCENLHVEEQHQLKYYFRSMNMFLMEHQENSTLKQLQLNSN